jgi:hypothetical protein
MQDFRESNNEQMIRTNNIFFIFFPSHLSFLCAQDLREQQREDDPQEQGIDAQPLHGQAQDAHPAGLYKK